MDTTDSSQKLWRELHGLGSRDEVVRFLLRIGDLTQSSAISSEDAFRLRADAFRLLQELTSDEPTEAWQLISDFLLPFCIGRSREEPQEVQFARSRYRDRLATWLAQYAEEPRAQLRVKVLDTLRNALKADDPSGACWTIAVIGYRQPDIVSELWEVVRRFDHEVGDWALSTLTALGIPASDRDALLTVVHARARIRCNLPLIGALRRLADPSSIELVRTCWLLPNEATAPPPGLKSLALRVLTDVSDELDDDADLQEHVWQIINELRERFPQTFEGDLLLGGDISGRCDSLLVVPTFVAWIAKEAMQVEELGHRQYLLCHRLEQCFRPRQLLGWKQASVPEAIQFLRTSACRDTADTGYQQTGEMLVKEAAWDTLLCLGHNGALSWFEEAVAGEANQFVRQEVCERLACFRMEPLPETVIRWVTEEYDRSSETASDEWAFRIAAIQIARSSASLEAFQALQHFGLTFGGEGLVESANALADVAITLAKAGNSGVVDRTVEMATSGSKVRHRMASESTLVSLAAAELLPARYAFELAGLASNEERDLHERGLVVTALGFLSPGSLNHEILERLNIWATERNDEVGWRSLEALARHDRLIALPHLLTGRLGLREYGSVWDLDPKATRVEWGAFIIGLLYMRHPQIFGEAVASVIRTQEWMSVFQVLRFLWRAVFPPGQATLPASIEKALLERVKTRQTRRYAERDLFEVLARLSPHLLANQPWERMWDEWLPEARAALADSLGTAEYARPEYRALAVARLVLLAGDSQYVVRRAAYRAISRVLPNLLEKLCVSWADGKSVQSREKSAECCGWLAASERENVAAGELFRRLKGDIEPRVRKAAERVWHERRERIWAEQYLSHVCAVRGIGNEEVLAAWCYGQALKQIGDDSCVERLEKRLAEESLPPNVRYWLQHVSKAINERWRKVTREWSEHWLSVEGAVSTGRATLKLPSDQEIEVHCSLWLQPAATPLDLHSWGGAAWASAWFPRLAGERVFVRLESGHEGSAIVTGVSSDGLVVFVGSGPYPS